MSRWLSNTALVFLSILLLLSCSGRGRVLSEKKMTELYADLFISDQWLKDHTDFKSKADSTQFFEPVFKKHGVSFEDFDRSVMHYLENPGVYSKIVLDASESLKREAERLDALVNANAEVELYNSSISVYKHQTFDPDSLFRPTPGCLAPVLTGLDAAVRVSPLKDSGVIVEQPKTARRNFGRMVLKESKNN